MSGNIAHLQEALEADDGSDDEFVVYQPTTQQNNYHDLQGNRSDDSPIDIGMSGKERRKGWQRYKPALSTMAPIRSFRHYQEDTARVDQAGCLSFITYGWIFSYLWSAFRGLIPHDQTWQCSPHESASVNVARLEQLWKEQLTKPQPSLAKAIIKFFRSRFIIASIIFLFCLAFGFIGPSCLVRALIAYAEEAARNKTAAHDRFHGVGLAASLFVVELCRVLSYGACWAISYRTGIRVRTAVLGLVYKKLIHLRTLRGRTPAEIVNIFGNDGQRLFDAITFAPLVAMGPLVLIAGLVYLLMTIGPWSLLGILVFFVFDVFQAALGISMVKFRKNAIAKTEERVSTMGEIIKAIKTIKMNAWEQPFIDKVTDLRHEEKTLLGKAGYAQSLAIAAGPVVPAVAAIVTFLAFIAHGNTLTSSDAFSSITIFFVMVFGIRMIPYGMRYVGEAMVGIRAIQDILFWTEADLLRPPPANSKLAVVIQGASFAWEQPVDKKPEGRAARRKKNKRVPVELYEVQSPASKKDQLSLSGVNLVIERGKLVGICGSVGSGKSSLLNAIIGQMVQSEGSITVGGGLAYASQEPWIQNASLKENILFDDADCEFDEQLYYRILYACSLTQDIASMPANDQTEIGERGATLSGGQKSRVALARALYSNREIYLLDNILAALDGPVAEHVFTYAIRGILLGKTILFVTSNIQHLESCDEVILMDKGRVIATGDHTTLLESSTDYARFVDQQIKQQLNRGESIDNLLGDSDGSSKKQQSESELSLLKSNKLDERERTGNALSTAPDANSLMDIPSAVQGIMSGQLVESEEDSRLSSISWSVYNQYIQASGGWLMFIVVLALFSINVGTAIFSTVWLSEWLKEGAIVQARTNMTLSEQPDFKFYAIMYGMSIGLLAFTSTVKAMAWVKISLNAASMLHKQMFNRLIRGSMRFFDSTPTGRILNRFSKDLDEVDVKLPFTAETFLQNSLTILGYLIVISVVFPYFLLACIPLAVIFSIFVACFRAGIRHLKRSENISRSPLFDHIQASLEGLSTIHAFGQTRNFNDKLRKLLDSNSAAMFMYQSAMRWLAVWLDLVVVLITFTTALLIVLTAGTTIPPAYAGMALAFAIQMSGIFQFAVRMQTELEAKMTSVERIDFYSQNIEKEGEWIGRDFTPPIDWPSQGRVSFRDVKLKYRDNLPLALKNISFDVRPHERVGIVGRTGSGKSSLGVALFRLYPVGGGSISLDGIDCETVGLHELRRNMEAIPQDPILFNASYRFNLDPLRQHNDDRLWEALDKTYLKAHVQENGGLYGLIGENGMGLSSGQRQLLCMARALLRSVRILLLDEATSSLDSATDALIHDCLRKNFAECTLLIIAHRLDSIMETDKIIFMDQGKVVEFDKPGTLMENPESRFYRMTVKKSSQSKGPKTGSDRKDVG